MDCIVNTFFVMMNYGSYMRHYKGTSSKFIRNGWWMLCTIISMHTTIVVHTHVNQITQTTLNGTSHPNKKISSLATNRNQSPKTHCKIDITMWTNKTYIKHKKIYKETTLCVLKSQITKSDSRPRLSSFISNSPNIPNVIHTWIGSKLKHI
jgi:hypothetical protein